MLETGEEGLYVASFLGFAPMDDPEIAILLILDEPKGENYYGGVICTTVVGEIMSEVLPYLGYEPQYTDKELANMAIKVPEVIDKDIKAASTIVKNSGLTPVIVGSGEKVIGQMPDSSQSVFKGGTVILYTDEETEADKTTVPNFAGLTAAGVNELAIKQGINVRFNGTSVTMNGVTAYKQSIAPNTQVDKGTIVEVEFKDSTILD